jgi:hypothetical protein
MPKQLSVERRPSWSPTVAIFLLGLLPFEGCSSDPAAPATGGAPASNTGGTVVSGGATVASGGVSSGGLSATGGSPGASGGTPNVSGGASSGGGGGSSGAGGSSSGGKGSGGGGESNGAAGNAQGGASSGGVIASGGSAGAAGNGGGGGAAGNNAGRAGSNAGGMAGSNTGGTAGAPSSTGGNGGGGEAGASASPAAALDKFRFECPCKPAAADHTNDGNCNVTPQVDRQTVMKTMGGDPNKVYNVTLRVRGLSEPNTYKSGMLQGERFYIGGSTSTAGYTSYMMTTADPAQHYFFNYSPTTGHVHFKLDYQVTVKIRGGSKVTFDVDGDGSVPDGHQVSNFDQTVVPDVPPAPMAYDGQFIQLDVVSAVEAP